jgi:hypothetical protein
LHDLALEFAEVGHSLVHGDATFHMLRIVAFKTRRDNRKYRNREFVNSGGRELSAAAARGSGTRQRRSAFAVNGLRMD